MDAKLTLKLDDTAIAVGKQYAAEHGKSLSRLVQDYFLLLSDTGAVVKDVPISRKLESLVGIGSGPFDESSYREHLEAKHA